MDKAFKGLIIRNVKVYTDNIMVKSELEEKHMDDLDKVFKANPNKCKK